MKKTIKELHLVAQYLAAAGISFIEKKADDSHTNIAWNKILNRMETHKFNSDFQLGYNLNSSNIEWIEKNSVTASINVNTNTHQSILNWISDQVNTHGISKEFVYQFHYELPYNLPEKDHVFYLNADKLSVIASELTKAQDTFEGFLNDKNLDSPIRIWPHHFDIGIYTSLDGKNKLFLCSWI